MKMKNGKVYTLGRGGVSWQRGEGNVKTDKHIKQQYPTRVGNLHCFYTSHRQIGSLSESLDPFGLFSCIFLRIVILNSLCGKTFTLLNLLEV